MFLVKNTYGISAVISPEVANLNRIGTLTGSSLNRKKYPKKYKDIIGDKLEKPLIEEEIIKQPVKLRSMSPRTKSKIKKRSAYPSVCDRFFSLF